MDSKTLRWLDSVKNTTLDTDTKVAWLSLPRTYALELIDHGYIDESTLINVLLKGTSHDYLREILDANELSPRFL